MPPYLGLKGYLQEFVQIGCLGQEENKSLCDILHGFCGERRDGDSHSSWLHRHFSLELHC